MKKALIRILCVVMCLSALLTGCNRAVDDTTDPNAEDSEFTPAWLSPDAELVPDPIRDTKQPEFPDAVDYWSLLEGKEVYDKFIRLTTAQRIVYKEDLGNTELYIPYQTIPVGYIVSVPVIVDGLSVSILCWRQSEEKCYFTLDLCPRLGAAGKGLCDMLHYPIKLTEDGMLCGTTIDEETLVWLDQEYRDDEGVLQLQWRPSEDDVFMDYCRPLTIQEEDYEHFLVKDKSIPLVAYPWLQAGVDAEDYCGIPYTTLAEIANQQLFVLSYEQLSGMVWYVFQVKDELFEQLGIDDVEISNEDGVEQSPYAFTSAGGISFAVSSPGGETLSPEEDTAPVAEATCYSTAISSYGGGGAVLFMDNIPQQTYGGTDVPVAPGARRIVVPYSGASRYDKWHVEVQDYQLREPTVYAGMYASNEEVHSRVRGAVQYSSAG